MSKEWSWLARYADGSTDGGPDTTGYRAMIRDGLVSFCVEVDGKPVLTTKAPDGANGRNLRYRITTEGTSRGILAQRARVGWVPMGPAYVVDPYIEKIWRASRFHLCVPGDGECVEHDDAIGWFDPPDLVGGER
jgi:hypothetical protein